MMKFLWVFLCIVGAVSASDFLTSVKTVVDSLPQVTIATLEHKRTSEEKQSSVARVLPHVTGSVNQRVGYEAFNLPEEEMYHPTEATLRLQQQLLDMRTFQNISIAKTREHFAEVQRLKVVNRTVRDFCFDWAYFWRNCKREEIVNDIVDITGQDLKNTEYRYQVGELTRVDVTKIASKHYGYLNNQSTAKKEKNISKEKLAEYYKIEVPPIADLPQFSLDHLRNDSTHLHNPDYLLAQLSEEISHRVKKQEVSDFIPVVSGSASAKHVRNSDNSSLPNSYNDFGGAVSLTWNIFKGTEHYSSLAAARYAEGKAVLEKEKVRREVVNRIIAARENVTSAMEQVTISEKRLAAAKEGMDGTQSEYITGTRTTTDLVSAQEEYLTAQLESVDIALSLFLAQIVYLETLGILVPETIGSVIVREDSASYE